MMRPRSVLSVPVPDTYTKASSGEVRTSVSATASVIS